MAARLTSVYDPRIDRPTDRPTKRVNSRSPTKLLFRILQNSRNDVSRLIKSRKLNDKPLTEGKLEGRKKTFDLRYRVVITSNFTYLICRTLAILLFLPLRKKKENKQRCFMSDGEITDLFLFLMNFLCFLSLF